MGLVRKSLRKSDPTRTGQAQGKTIAEKSIRTLAFPGAKHSRPACSIRNIIDKRRCCRHVWTPPFTRRRSRILAFSSSEITKFRTHVDCREPGPDRAEPLHPWRLTERELASICNLSFRKRFESEAEGTPKSSFKTGNFCPGRIL